MKALILNSGIGKRLGALTRDTPKCLVELRPGFTILDLQLRNLEEAGISEIVMTTGPFPEKIRERVKRLYPGLKPSYIHNPLFESTNYIYSLHLAAGHIGGDILLLHGDLVFETEVLQLLAASPHESAVLVDAAYPLPHKDFKARLVDGYVAEISVALESADCALLMPAYKLSQRAARIWLDEIARFIARGEVNAYAENALNAVSGEMCVKPLDFHGRLCLEVDDAEDLAAARSLLRHEV